MNTKTKNPLYVVTNKGQDVEEAQNFFDALVKKLGLEPVLSILEGILQELLQQVSSFAIFLVVKAYIDQLVDTLEKLIKKFDPVLAFSIYKR
ncbi:MAG: hypothetical protein CME70_15020 [Halobacteriovorax sp.]|nr:hypothetical protein [Halobacteriovorax sp.]|tara:strand:+ start:130077 stop:130352 length:276 start_codon:yes stop_codon:yes gene_type:complete